VNSKARPRLAPAGDAARDTERTAGSETIEKKPPQVDTRSVSRSTRNRTSTQSVPSNAGAKIAKVKTRARKSKRTTGRAKTGKVKTTSRKATTTKPTRKAAVGRNVGGGAASRSTVERRKS
jgi:hypothetical protein